MKKILLSALAAAPLLVNAQSAGDHFTVTGKITNHNALSKIFLEYENEGRQVVDSSVLEDGIFSFKGLVAAPGQAYLILPHDDAGRNHSSDLLDIFLEKGDIRISEVADSIKDGIASGTPGNKDLAEFKKLDEPARAIDKKIMARRAEAPAGGKVSPEFEAATADMEFQMEELEHTIAKRFIKSHPQSSLSLQKLEQLAYPLDYAELVSLFKGLAPALRDTEKGKQFAAKLATMEKVAIGKIAPDFAIADTAGNMVKLSSLRGKYVLVDLWASWCPPCRAENPNVVKVYNKYKDNNFTVIGVSLDQSNGREKWIAAIREDGLTWTQGSDLKFLVTKDYGVSEIPQNFLLDPRGKIIAKNLRGTALEKKVASLTSGKKS